MNPYRKDLYMTVTEAGRYLGLTKQEVKEHVNKGNLTPFKAFPKDSRYLLSMREINRIRSY